MSPAIQTPELEAACKFLNISLNPDGTITRLAPVPTVPPTPELDPAANTAALSKDIPLNTSKSTFIRLFRPANPPPNTKLPLLIYFHGGGFVFFSAATSFFHGSCNNISANIPAVIASVDYRLAPEHRLPAAYDDAEEALIWIKAQASGGEGSDPWIRDLADFSRTLLIGSSAGANIVYHTAIRALDLDLAPVKIVGLIMHQAYFGGLQRTESELRLINDEVVPLPSTDLMWTLALPEGADRGHKFCDPFAVELKEKIGKLPPCLLRGYSGDPLVDREKELAKVLEAAGVKVIAEFIDGGKHAAELFDPAAANATLQSFKGFVSSACDGIPVDKKDA